MDARAKLRLLHVATMVGAIVVTVLAHSGLPDRVAIHFGITGVADGWATRMTSVLFLSGAIVVVTAILAGVASLAGALPARFVNVPHRTYWLAPERKAETVAFIGAWGHGFGAAVNLFLAWIGWLVGRANLAQPPRLDGGPLWAGFIVFIVTVVASVATLVVRFGRVPRT